LWIIKDCIFTIIAVIGLNFYSNSSDACRLAIPSTGLRSPSSFSHVAVMQVVSFNKETLLSGPERAGRKFVRLRLIKSYRGSLPGEFFVRETSSDVCGHDFPAIGSKILAYFDAELSNEEIKEKLQMPFLNTSFDNYYASHMIRVPDLLIAEKIVGDAEQR
jgi:hypothetical protein